MFRILQDSLFNPRGLIKQVNRSGWFIFLCLLVMSIFMSIGTYVAYASYENSNFDYESSGCSLVDGSVVCDGENYTLNTIQDIYGIHIYFLNEDMTIDDITTMENECIVIQGDEATLYLNGTSFTSLSIFGSSIGFETLEEGMEAISSYVLWTSIGTNTVTNLILIIIISLIGSLMFLRYKQVIKYRKLYKLVVYGVFPIALLITFYNLLEFDSIIFFLLAIFAYRSLFVLNRELYKELLIRSMPKREDDPNVVDSYKIDDDEITGLDDNDQDNKEDK